MQPSFPVASVMSGLSDKVAAKPRLEKELEAAEATQANIQSKIDAFQVKEAAAKNRIQELQRQMEQEKHGTIMFYKDNNC